MATKNITIPLTAQSQDDWVFGSGGSPTGSIYCNLILPADYKDWGVSRSLAKDLLQYLETIDTIPVP